jgi:hypothetical protein
MHKSKTRVALDLGGLIGRVDVFRLSGAVKRDPAVERWFAGEPAELRSIAHKWFVEMRKCNRDVKELLHDGCPVACVADAPFGYVNAFKSHVNVGFFYGALLADPAGMLEGNGKRMRHVKLKHGTNVDTEGLRNLVVAAYADIQVRLEAERESKS